jgi:fructose-1-phosphate kinase PfkB-like protein
MARAKEHGFSVEMKSKEYVRRMSVSDNSRDAVVFEGFLGEIEEMGIVEEVILEIRAANGTLRIDLSEEELRKALRKKKEKT